MKKTSTRLAAIGGLILVAACAIALAQYDSRNRDREPQLAQKFSAGQIEPIQVDDEWDRNRAAHPIVRANNDRLTSFGNQENVALPEFPANSAVDNVNSLGGLERSEFQLPTHETASTTRAAFASYEASQSDTATLASGDAPVSPPAWLAGPASPAHPPANSLPTTAVSTPPFTGSLPQAGNLLPGTSTPNLPLPALPTVNAGGMPATVNAGGMPAFQSNLPNANPEVSSGSTPGPTASLVNPPNIPSLPSLATPSPSLPPTISHGSADMSDTQRGVMSPTDLSVPRIAVPNAASPQNAYVTPRQQAPESGQPASYLAPPNPAQGVNGTTGFPPNNESNPTPALAAPNASSSGASSATEARGSAASATNYGGSNLAQPSGNSAPAYASQTRPSTSLVSNKPGNRFLDGSQNPIVQIQKRAPDEIQVGKKATFVITVRNAGNAPAHEVTVVDSVPRGARLVEAAPAVTPTSEGILVWRLGEIAAGDERTITLQIVPEVQGEVGSVATVNFAAQASVRTVATLARIELLVETLPEVLIGDSHQITVVVKNTGTGVARAVHLEADIPPQFSHISGDKQLEAMIGDMRPNDTRRIVLDVTAIQPGPSECLVRAVTDDGVQIEERGTIAVRAPQLAATIEGPKVRYLDRPATYRINVINNGTAAATNLDFVVHLPSGLRFNSANHDGSYDQNTHSVSWGLYELPSGQVAPIELTVLPVELGAQAITFSAKGELGIAAEAKTQVRVDGLAELAFRIEQDNGTIETGSSTVYTVQIQNNGNKSDRDVSLAVELPPGTKLLAVMDAPVNYRVDGNQLLFAPIAEMRTNEQQTFRFQVQHQQAGTRITRSTVTSSNWQVAMVKEIGTLVYDDQN